jgi:hypothetical protein
MKVLAAVMTSALLGWSTASFAQTADRGSPCNAMTGPERDQCLRAEAGRTQGTPAIPGSADSDAAARDSKRYAETGSARCDALSGPQKDQCLREEGSLVPGGSASTGSSEPRTR